MRHFILVAGLACASALTMPSASARPSQQQHAEIFDYVWTEIRDRYYDAGLNGADWQAARNRYRQRAVTAPNEVEFYAALRGLVGELRDVHTRVLDPRQAADRGDRQSSTAGVLIFEVDGQPVIYDIRPGSPAAAAGLKVGMKVVAVGGVSIGAALDQARTTIGPSSSARAALVLSYLKLVQARATQPLALRVERDDGSAFDVSLPRQRVEIVPSFETRTLPSGALYVRFDRFREPVARRFRDALDASRNASGLIIDLRNNTGGDGKEGMRAIGPLLSQPTLIARLATRTGRPPSALLGLVSLPLELTAGTPGGQIYRGPVAILTNAATGSTAEVVAASLQQEGRAKIVGGRSCGCALGVLRYRKLKDGGALAISEVGLLTGNGLRIEGRGVTPDLAVAPNLSDFKAGRDPVLNAAEALLTR